MIKKIILILFFIVSLSARYDGLTYTKAMNLISEKEYAKAEQLLQNKLKKHPNDVLLLYAKAHLLSEKGNIDKSIVLLQKILNENNIDNKTKLMITNELNRLKDIQQAKENQNIELLKEVISDKGLEFLMIFLSILIGELLARDVHECEDLKEEKLLKNYLKIKKHKSFKEMKCFIISVTMFLTYTAFITLIIILIELFINPPYLQNITSEQMQTHVWIVISISFLINSIYVMIKYYFENKSLSKKIAHHLHNHYYENERLFNKELYLLNFYRKNHNDDKKLEEILNNIEIKSDREKIKEKLESI